MIGTDGTETHGTRMENCFLAEIAKTGMSVDYFDLLSQNDIAKDGEERENRRECRFTVDDKERYMIHF